MIKSIKILIKADKLPAFFQKMIDNKNAVKAYHKGELTIEQLREKGIKFVAPI